MALTVEMICSVDIGVSELATDVDNLLSDEVVGRSVVPSLAVDAVVVCSSVVADKLRC